MKRFLTNSIGATVLLLLAATNLFAQQEKAHIRKGNKQYEAGNYVDAENSYQQALDEKAASFEGSFNLGDAAYKQENYDDAINQFDLVSKQAGTKEQIGASYHNLGNAYLQKKEYEKSIEAYKQALRNNPSDIDTKYNLTYAQKQLQKQQEQQKQENKDKEEDKKEEDEKKDEQEKKDDQQKEQDKEKKEDKQKEDKKKDDQSKQDENKDQQQQQKPRPQQLSKEEAKKILEALKEKEMNVQDKLQKKKLKSTKMKSDKDW